MSKKSVVVQIREEEKGFAKTHIAAALGVSVSTIDKWTKQGKIPRPTSNRYNRHDILRILAELKPVPVSRLNDKNRIRWRECLESRFVVYKGGLFAISPSIKVNYESIDQTIGERGIWEAQGINNHEHINSYIANPISQLMLAEELIESWIKKAKALTLDRGTVVIYWNGRVDSALCVYLMLQMNESFLEDLDKYLGMKKTNVWRK